MVPNSFVTVMSCSARYHPGQLSVYKSSATEVPFDSSYWVVLGSDNGKFIGRSDALTILAVDSNEFVYELSNWKIVCML